MKATGKYLVTGLLAGAANGLFGSGGGLFLVPLFIGWLHMEEKQAFATSVAVILPLSIAALVIYGFKGGIDVMPSLPYLLGGLAGGLLSGKLFGRMPAAWLHRLFGLLILYGGVRAVLLL